MKVAVCLVVKNEAADVAEWIAFYVAIGVDTLIVFDNGSDDGTVAVLEAAARRFDVRLIAWPRTDQRSQMDAYDYCCRLWKDEFEWIGCFDSDEFLVLHDGRSLATLLDRAPDCAAVALNWAIFGSNGHVARPDVPVIEAFTHRSQASFFPNRHVKAFVRPRAVRACLNPHCFEVEGRYEDVQGRPVAWYFVAQGGYEERGVTQAEPEYGIAQLNHYFVRSRAHWQRKLDRGYPDGIQPRRADEFATYDHNDVEDRAALAWLPAVKRHLAAIADAPAAPAAARPERRPVVHVVTQGNMANRMIQYMVARRIAALVPGCQISNVDLPEWRIRHPVLPTEGAAELLVEGQRVDLDDVAERLRTGAAGRVVLPAFGQWMANFPGRAECLRLFPPDPAYPGYGHDTLVCNLRGGEVLDARHPHYTLLPARFYAELVARTGLSPVFTGQIEDNAYCAELRHLFPGAEFRPSEGAYADFQVFRSSQNLVPAVSTFSWLAAWLSEASRIVLPVNGLFHPVQCPEIDLLPLDDARYAYVLFPINYAVPVGEYRAAHAGLLGLWRQMRPEAIAALRDGPRWTRRLESALPWLDEAYYLASNPDVAAVVTAGQMTALDHYRRWGHAERRRAFAFDLKWYSRAYPMAAFEVGQGDYADLEHHYVEIGRARGYHPTPPA
ncbi:MAG: hypothetical protein NVSMB18_02050 [Acetobacteraceae bacterium]